ncbi:Splicing factor 3B subunit 1 [Kalmanozyma brasiliensis GHG001]|uniref:Putative splicing factor 3b subunit 1 n=1 Tax=Kalmanozyma brasiliensis (strain GHG001) TaxID=1365824 RepID=V5ED59_KALBG|nr:Splicing factor 3B subunit 1 [Kalmanozyma brasiliensis GHG001]EST08416.1 Splicing factor 3B subunit 1 [Kalmanozyma brasiliensis GHG001]
MTEEADEIRRLQEARNASATKNKVAVGKLGGYDQDIYGAGKRSDYVRELPMDAASDDSGSDNDSGPSTGRRANPLDAYSAPQHLLHEFADEDLDPLKARSESRQVAARQSDYHLRRFNRELGDGKAVDAFAENGQTKGDEEESYKDRMRRAELEREEERVRRLIDAKEKEAKEKETERPDQDEWDIKPSTSSDKPEGDRTPKARRKRRWDVAAPEEVKPETNGHDIAEASTEAAPRKRRSRWDEAPTESKEVTSTADQDAAKPAAKRSRWDQAPTGEDATDADHKLQSATSSGASSASVSAVDPRNRYLSDEELNSILPSEGYTIVEPPADYAPVRTPASKLMAAPAPENGGGFMMQDEGATRAVLEEMIPDLPTDIPGVGQLAFFKTEDQAFFKKILTEQDESALSSEEQKERKIMRLLLKIKNGLPSQRKQALRQISDRARDFGPGPLFDKILPLLMERTLEDQERHLLVKVIDRILYKLDDLVRPYVGRILVVIEPLLIDEDYYARIEGREIISNLSKAAGLAHMISTMRPDIDHVDEYVRNTTARAFAVVASALGIPALLPFLKAVCRSKKSWQARHTGIRIVQQIAIMMGCAILPHLGSLVNCVEKGLEDEQQKVKTMTALALAALAEAAAPYGIESFENVLKPLWIGIRQHRGKGLAAFLKAIGFIIPLMDSDATLYFVKEVTPTLIREFQSADEEMKKIVLKVVKQCAATDGVTGAFLRDEMLSEFMKGFRTRRSALDRRTYKQVVETTVELANKVGVAEIVSRVVNELKDESEPFRKMVMETIQKVVSNLGAADIDERLEIQLIDGLIYAFQEQTVEDQIMLEGVATVINALGMRAKPYLTQIVSTALWRLNSKDAKTRQQAADLTTKLAVVIKQCGEDALLAKLGVVLFEQLGEEFPDALASIISAETAIANVVGMAQMSPPIKDLLPRMTPILRNRHEKVQEASINLIGRIADKGAESVSPREWMRICFELLDLLKAHKKAIRRAAVNSFGYIARAIGPSDVLQVLTTNLRVQERQSRVCSTVAIAIVAETCGPFTTIPAILNEYRTPEVSVRTGALKSLAFLFQYIGEANKDYVYSVISCLEDALTDRDHVHRQTAASIVHHVALGTFGLGHEESLGHLFNLIWPNIFETSPHVLGSVTSAIESLEVALGPGVLLNHTLQGVFAPARKVREAYVRILNTTYLRSQDALTAYYPSFDALSTERNDYCRHALSSFI